MGGFAASASTASAFAASAFAASAFAIRVSVLDMLGAMLCSSSVPSYCMLHRAMLRRAPSGSVRAGRHQALD